jgi:hypothetical protein
MMRSTASTTLAAAAMALVASLALAAIWTASLAHDRLCSSTAFDIAAEAALADVLCILLIFQGFAV